MRKINWAAVLVFGVVVLIAFAIGASLFGGWGYGGWGMMGGWGFAPFGGIGMFGMMLFAWLIPLGLLVLTVLGVVWLVRAASGGSAAPAGVCPSCGRAVQADWKNCPHCGAALKTS